MALPPTSQSSERDLTRTAKALQSIPLADMVKASAMSLIQAQYELDQKSIELAKEMGDPKNGIELGGTKKSLLELGLYPSFYQFTEATINVKVDITVHESDEFSIEAMVGFTRGSGKMPEQLDKSGKKGQSEAQESAEATPEESVNVEAKPEAKREAKPEAKREAKPEAKPETKSGEEGK